MTMWAGKIEDDNMNPTLKTGEIVFYTDEQKPNNGEICRIVRKENGKSTSMIKRVYFLNNDKIILHSDNYLEHPPETLPISSIISVMPVVKPLFQNHSSQLNPVIQ